MCTMSLCGFNCDHQPQLVMAIHNENNDYYFIKTVQLKVKTFSFSYGGVFRKTPTNVRCAYISQCVLNYFGVFWLCFNTCHSLYVDGMWRVAHFLGLCAQMFIVLFFKKNIYIHRCEHRYTEERLRMRVSECVYVF